jgi:hypothetical protein
MDSRVRAELSLTSDAADFVRFCYQRRHTGWPELYDEMCHVASRGAFRGWGPAELEEQGVRFGLVEMPALAGLVMRVLEAEGRRAPRAAVVVPRRAGVPETRTESAGARRRTLLRALGSG